MRTWNKTRSYDSESRSAKNIVTEEDAVTRRRLAQVNISNVYVVGGDSDHHQRGGEQVQ